MKDSDFEFRAEQIVRGQNRTNQRLSSIVGALHLIAALSLCFS